MRLAFLCGPDRFSGRSFDHRNPWVVDRLRELAAIFAFDVNAYDALSNHFHALLHVDRGRACGWTATEVATRYGKLFPHTVRATRMLPEKARAKDESMACEWG